MVIGILAHVDAGKTTLSENILLHAGVIRTAGRVDHGDTFLDTDEMERQRGITIFSKEAVFKLGDKKVCLIDTPGHVDFSAEMERTLQALDYAVLVVSAAEGVQAHTETLWRLLEIYDIPVFIFVNKMDRLTGEDSERESLLKEIKELTKGIGADFSDLSDMEAREAVAVADEELLESYMDTGELPDHKVALCIAQRKLSPVYFGSALKDEGVDSFLKGFEKYSIERTYGSIFCARVFKIVRDAADARLTFVKVLGGTLKVKSTVKYLRGGESEGSGKIDQIRVYSGERYSIQNDAEAGTVCALTGLAETLPGQLISENNGEYFIELSEGGQWTPLIEPVLMYRMLLPEGVDAAEALKKLALLKEEEPQLNIHWNKQLSEINVSVMGKIQLEILKAIIRERFGLDVEFDNGNIVYKETIENTVEGVGHFEPLRHYAEVHLKLEPLPRGSGLEFKSECSEDELDRNWQRLILSHLKEKEHIGTLTGSPITDIRISLVAGRAHKKHTEGGDFRQAVYRAVRQGLMEAKSLLLEPYYSFRIELPSENIGRAMSDISRMYGSCKAEADDGSIAVITGECPVSEMSEYQIELSSYTKGRGKLFVSFAGYRSCHNEEEVRERLGYDAQSDEDNPTGSIFCARGAGFYVPWNQVKDFMHIEGVLKGAKPEESLEDLNKRDKKGEPDPYYGGEGELKEIFERTFKTSYHGIREPEKEKAYNPYKKTTVYGKEKAAKKPKEYVYKGSAPREEYLLVDGYNIIFSWEELKELSRINLDSARISLQEILCNYQGYTGLKLIVVFDAYRVQGGKGSVEKYKNIYVVYTKEAETADQYIEKTVHNIGNSRHVTVATSDKLEQVIILGEGALRMSAAGLREEVERCAKSIRDIIG